MGMDNLSILFKAACDHIRQNVIQGACLSNEDLLFLFSRYKVAVGATIGPEPSAWNLRDSAKWSAWQAVRHLSPDQAMQEYLDRVKNLYPQWELQVPNGDSTSTSADSTSSFTTSQSEDLEPSGQREADVTTAAAGTSNGTGAPAPPSACKLHAGAVNEGPLSTAILPAQLAGALPMGREGHMGGKGESRSRREAIDNGTRVAQWQRHLGLQGGRVAAFLARLREGGHAALASTRAAGALLLAKRRTVGLPLALVLVMLGFLIWAGKLVSMVRAVAMVSCLGSLALALAAGVLVRLFGRELLVSSRYVEKMACASRNTRDMRQARLAELEHVIGGCTAVQSMDEAGPRAVVLLTGATGFVGQCVLADLLDRAEDLHLQAILVLCRAQRGQSIEERLHTLQNLEVFGGSPVIRERFGRLVRGVEADLRAPGLGLSAAGIATLQEARVTRVVHCVAAVNFVEPLHEIVQINITATLQLKALADTWPNCRRFVHVSTAFVDPKHHPNPADPQPETLVPLLGPGGSSYSARALYESMLGSQWLATEAYEHLGFCNTYTFSKCVAEHLLFETCRQGEGAELIILRPCIVGPSWVKPRPGWAGPKPSTLTGIVALRLGRVLRFFDSTSDVKMAVVPVDVVSRAIVYAAFEHVREEGVEHAWASILHATWPACYEHYSWYESEIYLFHTLASIGLLTVAEAFVWLSIGRLVRVCPALAPSLHWVANVLPVTLAEQLGFIDHKLSQRAQGWLQLTELYAPYTTRTHLFSSRISVPASFDVEEYLYDVILQSRAFTNRQSQPEPIYHWRALSRMPTGWAAAAWSVLHDVALAVWAPAGGLLARLVSLPVSAVLRHCTSGIYVDVQALARARMAFASLRDEEGSSSSYVLVLAPSHQSYLDFVLLTWAAFRCPELGLGSSLPRVAAADDAFTGRALRLVMRLLGAFFIRRDGGRADPGLIDTIRAAMTPPRPGLIDTLRRAITPSRLQREPQSSGAASTVVEVFLEGRRTRDGRLGKPKTGVLRCLQEAAGERPLVLLPLSISYERLAEESTNAQELEGVSCSSSWMLLDLVLWACRAVSGGVKLGNVWIGVGAPVVLRPGGSREDVRAAALHVQAEQRRALVLSPWQAQALAVDLGVSEATVQEACRELGVRVMDLPARLKATSLPSDPTVRWIYHLRLLSAMAPLLSGDSSGDQARRWASWLAAGQGSTSLPSVLAEAKAAHELAQALVRVLLEQVDGPAQQGHGALVAAGYSYPSLNHLRQWCSNRYPSTPVPAQLLRAWMESNTIPAPLALSASRMGTDARASSLRLREPMLQGREAEQDAEAYGRWGFRDTRFVVQSRGARQPPAACLLGRRYPLSGRELPGLLPFLTREMHIVIKAQHEQPSGPPVPCLPRPSLSSEQLAKLEQLVGAAHVSVADVDRCRHGTGHSLRDVMALRTGEGLGRMPDCVVWPGSAAEVAGLLQLGQTMRMCVVPVGGGTNVTQALQCPSKAEEARPIISCDMRRMDRVLWVDKENGLAALEAGMVGRKLEQQLAAQGLTLGHEPDSMEFSTLGGWIATKASGMKRTRYGNIEDMVLAVQVATPLRPGGQPRTAQDEKPQQQQTEEWNARASFPTRASLGLNLRDVMLGSEGNLGIITSAVVRVKPLPQVQAYDSALFPSFSAGVAFLRDISRLSVSFRPASVRLIDNVQLRLAQTLRGGSGVGHAVLHWLVREVLQRWYRLDPAEMVGLTVVYEGSAEEVKVQQQGLARLLRKHGGLQSGAEGGRAGYALTFSIAYLRDFALGHHVLGESFETFVPWSRLEAMCQQVRQAVETTAREALVMEGRPMLSARVTQVYDEGACVYFYLAMYGRGLRDPLAAFSRLEESARTVISSMGGALSHHHGIGKAKQTALLRSLSPQQRAMLARIKQALDEHNVLGVRNGALLAVSRECADSSSEYESANEVCFDGEFAQ